MLAIFASGLGEINKMKLTTKGTPNLKRKTSITTNHDEHSEPIYHS